MRIAVLYIVTLTTLLGSSSAYPSPWWQTNINTYNYDKNSYGLRHTGKKIYFNCSLIDDSRHRILVDEDWDNKVRSLGYRPDTVAYNVISVSKMSSRSIHSERMV